VTTHQQPRKKKPSAQEKLAISLMKVPHFTRGTNTNRGKKEKTRTQTHASGHTVWVRDKERDTARTGRDRQRGPSAVWAISRRVTGGGVRPKAVLRHHGQGHLPAGG
jgi:hypothetical protein